MPWVVLEWSMCRKCVPVVPRGLQESVLFGPTSQLVFGFVLVSVVVRIRARGRSPLQPIFIQPLGLARYKMLFVRPLPQVD